MFILGLVVIYIYAVISFALIPNYFNPERDEFCESVFECFITITRLGLLDTLGLVCSICHSLKLHLYYLEMGNSEIFNYHDTSEAEIVCPSHTPLIEPSNRKKTSALCQDQCTNQKNSLPSSHGFSRGCGYVEMNHMSHYHNSSF